jgi:hypothetical protein
MSRMKGKRFQARRFQTFHIVALITGQSVLIIAFHLTRILSCGYCPLRVIHTDKKLEAECKDNGWIVHLSSTGSPLFGVQNVDEMDINYNVGIFTTLIHSASSFQWPFDGDDQCRVCVSPIVELTRGLQRLLLESLWLPIVNFSLIPWIQLRAFFLDLSIPIFFVHEMRWLNFLFCFPIHILELILLFLSWALDDSQSRLVSISLGACVTLLLQLLPSVKKRINSRWMPDSLRTLRFQLVACYKLKPDFFSLIMQVLRYWEPRALCT